MASEWLVSVGYGRSADYIDLMANGYNVVTDTWQSPVFDPGTGLWTSQLTVACIGETASAAVNLVNALQTKLNQARKAAGRFGQGLLCTHGIRLDTDEWVYLPFARHPQSGVCGEIVPVSRQEHNLIHTVTLILYTEPLGLGDLETVSVSGAISVGDGALASPGNAGAGGFYIADVKGNLDAPCTLKLIDGSGGSKVINQFIFGRKSGANLAAADFDPVLNAVKSGADSTQTTATGTTVNNEYSRITTTTEWVELATVSGPSPILANRGPVDVLLRMRDAGEAAIPTNLTGVVQSSSGSWPIDTYLFRVTGMFGSFESNASNQATVQVVNTGNDRIKLDWSVQGAPTDHKMYWSSDNGLTWQYILTGSALGTKTYNDQPSGTAGTPSTSGGAALAQTRLRTGLTSLLKLDDQLAHPTTLAGSRWHLARNGQHFLPGTLSIEGYTDPGWAYKIEGKAGDLPGLTLDVDAAIHLPADEPQLTITYPDQDLTTQREWIASTRYDLGTACLLRSKTDQTEKGRADVDGYMTLAPGDNILITQATIAGGEHDTQNTSFTLLVTYRPGYSYLRGT